MNRFYTISFLFVFIFISSLDLYSKRKPKWITNRPVDSEYYIGIGKANKKTNTDYQQTAKNNALADMISEISVQISSNSILQQIEDKNGLKEKYEATIQLSVKNTITNYQIVDSWENKDEYWIYYRLSKSEYAKLKREKLERAKSLAKDFYEKAKEAEKKYDVNNALIYYIKSFDAIKNHLGEDLSVFTFEGKIFLDNAIFQSIQDIFSKIRIVPEKDIFTIKALYADNEPVVAKIKLKTELETQNISNVPLIFSFPELNIEKTEKVVSKNNGKAECTIANMAPKGRTQIIKAELDIENYFGKESEDNILRNILLARGTIPYGNIYIEVKELFAYLESEEKIWGNQNTSQPLTSFFKEELSEKFFSFTDDKNSADVIIKISSEINKGTKLDKHNLHTAFLNCNISMQKVKNNLVIFNDGFTSLKGMQSGSFDAAALDAIQKAKKKISADIIPGIRKIKI